MNMDHNQEDYSRIEALMDFVTRLFFIGALVCFIPFGLQLFF
ncbi:hypothetical protein SAMN05877753_102468 [Bacillus oleivorans]|uniref:Uncharacterized protein n=1 Tax=Bacillus oleivorans TaxID=1448271 RepID=A0A285CLA5_9BACI|nr:hypothetical protein [Bacillus oleivorans]SNX68320.1 hypothetical protein SAMN05877753_102468 [Bacillus oleivorans]